MIGLAAKVSRLDFPAASQRDGNPKHPACASLVSCLATPHPSVLSIQRPREGLLLTTINTHSPGTLFNSKPTSHILFPHQQHHRSSCRPRRLCFHGLTRQGCSHPLIPHSATQPPNISIQSTTHPRDRELGRKRPASASATTASESSAILLSRLASITKAISLLLRPISPCFAPFHMPFHFPRPNAARQGQSAWCLRPTLYPKAAYQFQRLAQHIFICSTCLPRLSHQSSTG